VITKIVQVEVQSEDLRQQVGELNQRILEWEQRCTDRDRTVASVSQQVRVCGDKSLKIALPLVWFAIHRFYCIWKQGCG
jgi:cell division protein FtsL